MDAYVFSEITYLWARAAEATGNDVPVLVLSAVAVAAPVGLIAFLLVRVLRACRA